MLPINNSPICLVVESGLIAQAGGDLEETKLMELRKESDFGEWFPW